MSKRPTLLVINAGFEQRPLVEAAARLGARVVAVHPDGSWERDMPVDEVHQCDLRDLPGIVSLAERIQPDGVAADECDYSAIAAAVVADRLKLPGASLRSAQNASNKWLQRRAAAEAGGIAQPRFALVANDKEAELAASEIGYPVIVKPIDNRGGIGIRRVDDPRDLAAAVNFAIIHAASRLALVEAFIDGVQMMVDGYAFPKSGYRELVVSSKRMAGNTHVASDILSPAEVSDQVIAAVREANTRVAAALGIDFGMTHAEYMVDRNGVPHLIEMANRGGGVLISAAYVPGASGIDIQTQLAADALGLGRDLLAEAGGAVEYAAWMRFLLLPPNRSVVTVRGEEETRRLPGVRALWVKARPGTRTHDVRDDLDRMGFVIAIGKDRNAALQTVERAESTLQIETVPAE